MTAPAGSGPAQGELTTAGTRCRDRVTHAVGAPGPADFDLLVIGTGGAGVAAAIQGAELGARVGVVERGTIGGTCVNVGCIPSKNLIEAAARYHAARTPFPGITPCDPSFAWREVMAQKRALVGELRRTRYVDVLASYPRVALLHGRARLVGTAGESGSRGWGGIRIRIDADAGEADAREVIARRVVIAAGTAPSPLPVPGIDEVDALDSTTAMELEELPASMIVVGGGAVGLELGQTFARFGVKVTVVERMPRLLPEEDAAISTALAGYLRAEGIEIHTATRTTRVQHDGSGVIVHVEEGTLAGELRAARLLVAAGRRPQTGDLGVEAVGVTLAPGGFVQVDATMRTSNPAIYAAGDVTGGPGYVYVAAAAGRVAAENAVTSLASTATPSDTPSTLDRSAIPSVTFTAPQVGSVGLTEARARALGLDVRTVTLRMDQVPRALASHDTRGFVTMVSDAATGKLLGVHALAPSAGELMSEATLAIRFGLTARDVAATLHPYLTWGESIRLAAQGFATDLSRLSCCA